MLRVARYPIPMVHPAYAFSPTTPKPSFPRPSSFGGLRCSYRFNNSMRLLRRRMRRTAITSRRPCPYRNRSTRYLRNLQPPYIFVLWTELHDVTNSGQLDQKTVKRMLLSLRVPQLSWDAFARSAPLLQTAQSITADEFAAGFFEAFVL